MSDAPVITFKKPKSKARRKRIKVTPEEDLEDDSAPVEIEKIEVAKLEQRLRYFSCLLSLYC